MNRIVTLDQLTDIVNGEAILTLKLYMLVDEMESASAKAAASGGDMIRDMININTYVSQRLAEITIVGASDWPYNSVQPQRINVSGGDTSPR